jgi:hypothetical protein
MSSFHIPSLLDPGLAGFKRSPKSRVHRRMKHLLISLFCLSSAVTLTTCSTTELDPDGHYSRLIPPFKHEQFMIHGWRLPPISDEGSLVCSTELIVSDSSSRSPRRVRLRQGASYAGMTLERVSGRPDTIGNPETGLAAIITTDFALRLPQGAEKRYLVLRDMSGYPSAFYCDFPHPELTH